MQLDVLETRPHGCSKPTKAVQGDTSRLIIPPSGYTGWLNKIVFVNPAFCVPIVILFQGKIRLSTLVVAQFLTLLFSLKPLHHVVEWLLRPLTVTSFQLHVSNVGRVCTPGLSLLVSASVFIPNQPAPAQGYE